MLRIWKALLCLALCWALLLPVYADGSVTGLQNNTAVDAEGSCQVSLTVRLKLDAPEEDLAFPVPREAGAVRVNGRRASLRRVGQLQYIDLNKAGIGSAPGEYTVAVSYTLSGAVAWTQPEEAEQEPLLVLTLPLLSGPEFEVESMDFAVSLPGEITGEPVFSSGYFGESILSYMTLSKSGNLLSGSINTRLKDHETLQLTLPVSPETFPDIHYRAASGLTAGDIGVIVCAAAALVYWLLTMRCLPLVGRNIPSTVDGGTAGELGCRLTLAGRDLTMMVLTWARLGYLTLRMDDNGRVFLHRRMQMGNERGAAENHIFQRLFPKRKNMVDGTGYHYARLSRQVAKMPVKPQGLFRRGSGNPGLLRFLAMLMGPFCGLSMALSFTASGVLATGLTLVLGAAGAAACLYIQGAMQQLHLRFGKARLRTAGGIALVWMLLGIWSGAWVVCLCTVLAQLLAGLGAAYGGRRTDAGRQTAQQILNLRRYLCNISREEAERICAADPNLFFRLLPEAMALGVENRFAQCFGSRKMPECDYLLVSAGTGLTAGEWAALFRDVTQALDERNSRPNLDLIFGR